MADIEVDKVADIEVNMVADMEVNMVADRRWTLCQQIVLCFQKKDTLSEEMSSTRLIFQSHAVT